MNITPMVVFVSLSVRIAAHDPQEHSSLHQFMPFDFRAKGMDKQSEKIISLDQLFNDFLFHFNRGLITAFTLFISLNWIYIDIWSEECLLFFLVEDSLRLQDSINYDWLPDFCTICKSSSQVTPYLIVRVQIKSLIRIGICNYRWLLLCLNHLE